MTAFVSFVQKSLDLKGGSIHVYLLALFWQSVLLYSLCAGPHIEEPKSVVQPEKILNIPTSELIL